MAKESMELSIDLGPMSEGPDPNLLLQRLRCLRENGEFCDVEILAAGKTYRAHATVLAASSRVFHETLSTQPSNLPRTLDISDVTHPEAVDAMLDCIYSGSDGLLAYHPSCESANFDTVRLAQRYNLTALESQACQFLTSNLTTVNVLERLETCEEFCLTNVREKILEQLCGNPAALFVLVKDPEIVKVPAVLRDLLVRVLTLLDLPPEEIQKDSSTAKGPQTKRAKKAGA